MLYIVSTPIGNAEDITLRALSTLRKCDIILCEDTRRSGPLLKKFDITAKLISFHSFNESGRLQSVLKLLDEGKEVALISDAGTPLISDPGENLVSACLETNHSFTVLPGPCSVIAALTLSGFDASRFQFLGFLPKKGGELSKKLMEVLAYPGTTIAFESPARILNLLSKIEEMAPLRKICVLREITKKFEERVSGTASDVQAALGDEVRGEIVIIFDRNHEHNLFVEKDIEKSVLYLKGQFNLSTSEAIKLAAYLSPLSKQEVYKQIHG